MTDGGVLLGTPENLHCEVKFCTQKAFYVYGPECEAETGKLMYLCALHAQQVREWKDQNANEPTMCPTHGNIGPVKSYVILKELS